MISHWVYMNINILINHTYIQVCQEALKPYIYLVDLKPDVSIGYDVHKITYSKGKKHIQSTIDYKKKWKQHEEAGENMPLHRAIRNQGNEPDSFELI